MCSRLLVAVAALTLIAATLACGSAATPTSQAAGSVEDAPPAEPSEAHPSPTTPPPTRTSPPPTETPNPNLVKIGTYIVGTDIQPGLYRGDAGQDLFQACDGARLKDFPGQLDAILSNDNSIGQFYIEVKDTDFALETACELLLLQQLPEPPAEYPQTIEPGTYLIGIDIQPGTYQGQAGTDAFGAGYWTRVRGVRG